MKAAELVKKHHGMSDDDLLREIAALPEHEKDLLVPCKVCGANEGVVCRAIKSKRPKAQKRALTFEWKQGVTVHIARRIGRLLKGIR